MFQGILCCHKQFIMRNRVLRPNPTLESHRATSSKASKEATARKRPEEKIPPNNTRRRTKNTITRDTLKVLNTMRDHAAPENEE